MFFTSGQGLCICSFHWGKLILPYLQEKINENGSQNVSQVSTEDRKNREIKKGKTQGPWPSCCCYSVTQSSLTPRDPIDCSTPGLPVLHHLPEFAQVHVHRINDAIQPSHQVRQVRWSGIPISLRAFHRLL